MIAQKYKQLLESLQKTTEIGVVEWRQTSLETKFELRLGQYRISVYRADPDSLEIMFPDSILAEINFIDENGTVFDTIKAQDKKSDEYQTIDHLFQTVRRKVLDIDNKLDQIQGIINSVKGAEKS